MDQYTVIFVPHRPKSDVDPTPLQYKAGDRVYLNDPRNIFTGRLGTIEGIGTGPNPYLFRLDGDPHAFHYEERHLSATPGPSYSQEADLAYRQEIGYPGSKPEPVRLIAEESPHDFDGGFGIGGLSRHSEDEGLAEMIASGQLVPQEPTGRRMPHGQLWEPCARRGCNAEPVCLDCGFCEKHCTC